MSFAESLRRYRFELLGLVALLGVTYGIIVQGMVSDWIRDPNYSHGFLVPLIAGYLLWLRRGDLAQAEVQPNNAGLPVILGGVAVLLLGWLASEFFTMRLSLLIILGGSALYLFGRQVFDIVLTPLLYLVLMIPIPYVIYNVVAFPLKLFVSDVSVTALKAMGIVVWREGNIIMFPDLTLEVADACSGMRSIMSLLALSAAYALIFHTSKRDRIILILASLPIAIATNALRVIATGVLSRYFGAAAAEGFFHEFAGLFVFMAAVALLLGLGTLLKKTAK
ncbi:eight transmembrane protein EpsH [Desulfovibrio sp. X2]|uniref:exosortase A n=1 Tax=Desulfovibrio sp. X2 TaxID=941449 RepID=UPI000358DA4F|nr:exosortase A [Desulfovibrio sp. X2]EPR37225.1 eight transmembrane protein EpsH [Desulfovibrio sp. X2]